MILYIYIGLKIEVYTGWLSNRFLLVIIFRYLLVLIVCTNLFACEKINETNVVEYKALCSEYGHAQNSAQFSKCVKRQNIIAKYENENWLMLTLGLK